MKTDRSVLADLVMKTNSERHFRTSSRALESEGFDLLRFLILLQIPELTSCSSSTFINVQQQLGLCILLHIGEEQFH